MFTIAVARFVDKSQLFSTPPPIVPTILSLSVCPSIKTEISGFSANTFPKALTAFFPSVPTVQLPDSNNNLFSIETYTFPFLCSTDKPFPSNAFKAFDKDSFNLFIAASLSAIIFSNSAKRVEEASKSVFNLFKRSCSALRAFCFASNSANNSRFFFMLLSKASLLFFSSAA